VPIRSARRSTGSRVAASAAVGLTAAALAGTGTFGTFSSSATAGPVAVQDGTVVVRVAAGDGSAAVPLGYTLDPGSSSTQLLDLVNGGSAGLGSVTLALRPRRRAGRAHRVAVRAAEPGRGGHRPPRRHHGAAGLGGRRVQVEGQLAELRLHRGAAHRRLPVIPGPRRVAVAALVAALASGIVLLIGRLGSGDPVDWPLALGLFSVLLGAQLIGPGPAHPSRTPRGR
jgi:hypothetical protein